MLTVSHLSKSFGGLRAVDDVTFEVHEGGVTALIGPNGAGKSTVFNLVSGAIKPDAGSVRLAGTDVTGLAPHRLAARGISRSFQITNLFPGFSVRETLLLARLSLTVRKALFRRLDPRRAEREWITAHAARYGLEEVIDRPLSDLSHGDRRRLEIATSMARDPVVLMLDEPTQGMGPAETEATEALIASLRGTVTVLLVEHDVDLVMGLADRIVVLQQGAKIADGTPDEIRYDPRVQDAYLGGVA